MNEVASDTGRGRQVSFAMSLAKILAVPVVLSFGLATYLWTKGNRISVGSWSKPSVNVPAPGPPDARTEGRWLVDEVARDMAEIILFATDPKADPAQVLDLSVASNGFGDVYTLSVKGPKGEASHALTLKHHVWSAAEYTPWARELLKVWQPAKSSGTAPDGGALARNLTDPTTATIIREERRLSKLLNQQPLDPELHEQAALVIGTFALREAAGNVFTDVRGPLCRMTTHLALARALRPKPGLCGQLAEVVELTLACRQADALAGLAKLPAGMEPWVTALKMRNTGDWRLCPEPAKATLLEQITWARAVAVAVDATPLKAFLEKSRAEILPDWGRIALGIGCSVEHGHIFAKPSIALEFADLATAWKAWSGTALTEGNLIMLLNDPARRAIERTNNGFELNVLGWGQFGAQHQRHLCHAICSTENFLRNMWGVTEQAEDMERQVDARFSELRLYPFMIRLMAENWRGEPMEERLLSNALREGVNLCNRQPQIVTACNWHLLSRPLAQGKPMAPPSAKDWFQPSMPYGTLFDFDVRIYYFRLPPLRPGDEDYHRFWENAIAVAPYDLELLRSYAASKTGCTDRLALDRQTFKNVVDFNLNAMRQIACHLQKDGKAYAAAMKTVCALQPDYFLDVGDCLLASHFEEEAAAAYQEAFDKAPDRVAVSAHCDWLVNYRFDHGRKEEALKIAMHGAEVYSGQGLETAANLMARMEKWEEGASYLVAYAERYNNKGPLARFLTLHRGRAPKLNEAYKKLVASVFPNGMEEVSVRDFTQSPEAGAQINAQSAISKKAGLKIGDVVVALDGIRVESLDEYIFVRALQPDTTPLALIVWDGAAYRELSVAAPKRAMGCGMHTYLR
jgi:hypothetical protein